MLFYWDITVQANQHLAQTSECICFSQQKEPYGLTGMTQKSNREWLEIRKTAGMVFQNPDNQIIASVVEEDVAFGPENMSVPTEEIWQRVAKSLESVDMTAVSVSFAE